MSTIAVLQPIDMNKSLNHTVSVSGSRFVQRLSTPSSGKPPSSDPCAKSNRRRRHGQSIDTKCRKEKERKKKELAMEKVRIMCPNLVQSIDNVNKRNGVLNNLFAGDGFTIAPPASDLPMPNVNWLHNHEKNVNIDDDDVVEFLP